jgi:MEKHLA domain
MASMKLATDPEFFALLTGSYARLVGAQLVPQGKDAEWLYGEAPFAVVAHNSEPDPKFIYATRCAQACFEYSWEEFISLPSRFSAEAPDRAERQALLDVVAQNGFMSGYRGIRVAKSGRLPHRGRRDLGADRREGDQARGSRQLSFVARCLAYELPRMSCAARARISTIRVSASPSPLSSRFAATARRLSSAACTRGGTAF